MFQDYEYRYRFVWKAFVYATPHIVDMIKTEFWINQLYQPVGEEDETPELICGCDM